MIYQLGVILVVIAFLAYLAAAFGGPLGELLVNGTIMFLIVYRGYYEFLAGRGTYHAIGAVAAFILLIFAGNYGKPFWIATTFIVTTYIIAFLVHYVKEKR